MDTRDAKTLRAGKHATGFGLRVFPRVTRAGVEEDRDEEEVEEALALLCGVDAGCRPGLEQGQDAGLACVEMAPPAMRRDLSQRQRNVATDTRLGRGFETCRMECV